MSSSVWVFADAQIKPLAAFSSSLAALGLPVAWINEMPPPAIQAIEFTTNPNIQPEFHPNTRGILGTVWQGPRARLLLPAAFEDLENPGSVAPVTRFSPKEITTIVHELWHAYWNWMNQFYVQPRPRKKTVHRSALDSIHFFLKQVEWNEKNGVSDTEGKIIFEEAVAEYLQALYMDMINFQLERGKSRGYLPLAREDVFLNQWNATRAGPQWGYSTGEVRSTGKVNLPVQIRSVVETLLGIPWNILDLPLPEGVESR